MTALLQPRKVWTTLITNTAYLSGLLTLDYSLKLVKSAYPLVALYTDSFPESSLSILSARGIQYKKIPYLLPSIHKDYSDEPRFYDCWSKLTPFSLTEFDRVVQLDSDMLVLKNMDELMDLELDPPELEGKGNKVFAAGHACVCNPLKKRHYPKDWSIEIPEHCAFTSQHDKPDEAQIIAPDPSAGPLGFMNGGLQVVNPSQAIYQQIVDHMNSHKALDFEFADQSLLSDLYRGRWVPLPYIYNALKTLRWPGVHDKIWRDGEVKNIHYILAPKPWDEIDANGNFAGKDETHEWWVSHNQRRQEAEAAAGILVY